MDISSIFGEPREYYQSKGISRIYYCYLDSANATLVGDSYQWIIGVNQIDAASIQVSEFPINIRAIRLGRTTWSNVPKNLSDYLNSGERIVYNIDEFSTQSMLPGHFIQNKPTSDMQSSPCTTTGFFQNRGWFRFDQLFSELSSITLEISKLDKTPIVLPNTYVTVTGHQYIDTIDTGLFDPATILNGLVIADYKILPLFKKNIILAGDSFSAYTIDSYVITHTYTFSQNIPGVITTQLFETNNEVFSTPYAYLQTANVSITQDSLGTPLSIDSLGYHYFEVSIQFTLKPRFVTTLEIHCDEF